ncbi:hypothetical protein WJX77_003261 [Trebouxia sp. C0004]
MYFIRTSVAWESIYLYIERQREARHAQNHIFDYQRGQMPLLCSLLERFNKDIKRAARKTNFKPGNTIAQVADQLYLNEAMEEVPARPDIKSPRHETDNNQLRCAHDLEGHHKQAVLWSSRCCASRSTSKECLVFHLPTALLTLCAVTLHWSSQAGKSPLTSHVLDRCT